MKALAFPVAYAFLATGLDRFRFEPWAFLGLVTVLHFVGPRARRVLGAYAPYLVFLYGYDMIRYAKPWVLSPERVHVCDIRQFESDVFAWLGASPPHVWIPQHTAPALDLFFAAPYFVFVYVVLFYATYLYRRDRPRMGRFLWTFAVGNLIAFGVWVVLPVAPPWYVAAHGCAVDVGASGSAAGLLRADQLLGISFFQTFYSHSLYTFGAMPSLHCSYPMMGLVSAWRHTSWRTRPIHIAYVTWMFLASVYLEHHYVVDGIAGMALAVLSYLFVTRLPSWRASGMRRLRALLVPAPGVGGSP